MHPPWSCQQHAHGNMSTVQPLSHGPSYCSMTPVPGHVSVVHGMFQMFNPFPMGHYASPMVLSFAVLHLSHGHGALDHRTFWQFNLCPMGHYGTPMGLSVAVPHLSHGHVGMDHATFQMFNPCPVGLPGPA